MKRIVMTAVAALSLAACQKQPAQPAAAPQPTDYATAAERTHHAAMPAAYHEFQVFGSGPVFLSHYPMFASIHAYQVILEAKLSPEGEAALKAFKAAHPAVAVSLSPSKKSDAALPERDDWVLPEETKPGRSFNGDLHWEAEGADFADPKARHYIARNVTAQVTRVVRRQMFYPDTQKSADLKYVVIGKGAERFMAHVLERYPDFDHIVRVEAVDDTMPAEGTVVTFRGRPNAPAERLKVGDLANGENPKHRAVRMKVVQEVGFEELEIQH